MNLKAPISACLQTIIFIWPTNRLAPPSPLILLSQRPQIIGGFIEDDNWSDAQRNTSGVNNGGSGGEMDPRLRGRSRGTTGQPGSSVPGARALFSWADNFIRQSPLSEISLWKASRVIKNILLNHNWRWAPSSLCD